MSTWKSKLKYKLRAAGLHLSASAVIFIGILYLILYQWYPEPFFTAQGGWQGIRLMAFVDLVLGPTLTLIVFNHLKKRREILFDMGVILSVQLTALLWGGYTVYTQRPLAMVFWVDAFYTVTQSDFEDQGIAVPDFSQYSDHFPPLVMSKPIESALEATQFKALTSRNVPAYAHVDTYRKIDDYLPQVFFNEVNISEVIERNKNMRQQLERITAGKIHDYRYVALIAKYQNMILVMREDGSVVGEVKAPPRQQGGLFQ